MCLKVAQFGTIWTPVSKVYFFSATLTDFHGDPRYEGDLHRADMAWALNAGSRGLSEKQIRDELLARA